MLFFCREVYNSFVTLKRSSIDSIDSAIENIYKCRIMGRWRR